MVVVDKGFSHLLCHNPIDNNLKIWKKKIFFLVAGKLNDQEKIHADESSVNNSAGSSTDNK